MDKEKQIILECATQIKYRSNVFVTFQKKKNSNKVRLHYSKRSWLLANNLLVKKNVSISFLSLFQKIFALA